MEMEPSIKKKLFNNYRKQKIAVYGLGIATEKLLKEIGCEFQIVGLLDSFRTEGVLYGKPVISMEELIKEQVKLIIVAARPGSCRAIARRIGNICIKNQIDLIDIRGKDLCALKEPVFDFKGVEGISKQELRQLMNQKQVISVDMFDTLVIRQTLFSSDVAELAECRLKEQGIFIENFGAKRLRSERELEKYGSPVLSSIYEHMEKESCFYKKEPKQLAELEWKIDYELLIPREEICELFQEMKDCGKEIYIVTDTYYTKEQLIQILDKCGISFYTDILASCEYKTGKRQQLFKKFREKIGERSCIHIGDDEITDLEKAEENGILSCRIYSGISLLEMAGYFGMKEYLQSLSGRVKMGILMSKIFNSPFQFEDVRRRISIDNAYDIGFLFFAPMVSDFVFWFDSQVKSRYLKNIWFCARDGYLIKKLYEKLNPENSSIYFLISRTAAVAAGVENEEDIRYIESMKFGGTLEEELYERFGVSVEELNGESLVPYWQEILQKVSLNKKGYSAYIGKINVKEGDIAFFDFVAKGTSQMYLGRLVDQHLKGLYFLQLEEEYMEEKGLDILSFYKRMEPESQSIFDDYYILETILTSPMPSLKKFDKNGIPLYADETRTQADIQCIQRVQDGISDYFSMYLKICPDRNIIEDKKIDAKMLSLLHSISILDEAFLNLKVEDPFFNRVTNMTDLL